MKQVLLINCYFLDARMWTATIRTCWRYGKYTKRTFLNNLDLIRCDTICMCLAIMDVSLIMFSALSLQALLDHYPRCLKHQKYLMTLKTSAKFHSL